MELQTICKQVGTLENGFDGVDERPVDCNFVLPDYLPDITAILKCVMKPVVQSHQISGDRILVEGTVELQLLYLDEERRCAYSYAYAQPFTSSFTVKEAGSDAVLRTSTRVNYVNCRATGPRRVDVHGSFNVGLTLLANGGTEVVTAAQGDGLFTKNGTVSGTVLCSQAEKTVSLNEVVDLGTAPAEAVIRNEAVAVITECRQMPGKAIAKGNLLLHTVYVGDRQTGTTYSVDNTIPFSQILDADGLEEDQLCDCRARVTQCEARLMQDPGGENRLLSVAAKVAITLECYTTESFQVVTDVYHTTYPVDLETKRLETLLFCAVHADTVTTTVLAEMPDGDIAEIVDLWCTPLTADCRRDDSAARIGGEVLVGMIASDGGGTLSYYERTTAYQVDWAESGDAFSVSVTPLEVVYSRNGDRLEIRLRLAVQCVEGERQVQTVASRVLLDETSPFAGDDLLNDCCLKVCFASAGESVWDLARREHTSPEGLKAENELVQDVLERDQTLLIPLG